MTDPPPSAGLLLVLGVAGLLTGSFLNVVVHRVPRGESVVRPRSACPSCSTPIAARDNVPVASWLLLRGRCRSCHRQISWRYPAVEVATGAAFVTLGAWQGWSWTLLPLLYLAAVSLALAIIDAEVRRLPDAIVLPSYVVLPLLLLPQLAATGEWWPVVRGLVGLVALFAFYDVLGLLYPRGMGGGDIKLAGLLGLVLGWAGFAELLVGAFAGFLLGGVYSITLLALGRAGLKSAIPFGPFMLAGAWVGLVTGAAVADWYLGTAGLG